MNCLLLLIILCCCGGNNSRCSRKDICGNVCKRDNCGVREEYGKCSEEKEHTCNHENHFCHTPPSMPGTHFPYLDVEPRTCGCEADENS